MLTTRRAWLIGLASAICAPAVLKLGLHMPVKAQPIIEVEPLWRSYAGHIDFAAGKDLAHWVERLDLANDPALSAFRDENAASETIFAQIEYATCSAFGEEPKLRRPDSAKLLIEV